MPDPRRKRLKELETVIESGWDSIVEMGFALREIRDEKLYLELGESVSFESYCKSRWSFSLDTVYRQIDQARISEALSPMGEKAIPISTERVGRELAPILHKSGPVAVAEAWSKISDRYRDQRPPTAHEVHKALIEDGYRERPFGVSSGPVNRRIKLGQYGDKLIAAEKRLDWFIAKELGDKPLADRDKRLAIDYAEKCERMARLLREMA